MFTDEEQDAMYGKFNSPESILSFFDLHADRFREYIVSARRHNYRAISGDALYLLSVKSGVVPERDGIALKKVPRYAFFKANAFSNIDEMINLAFKSYYEELNRYREKYNHS